MNNTAGYSIAQQNITFTDQKQKSLLRKQFRQKRSNLPEARWKLQSNLLCQVLSEWRPLTQAQCILAFYPFNGEPDLRPLWQKFPEKMWGFPRCDGDQLIFHHVEVPIQDRVLIPDRRGLLEPNCYCPLISLDRVDLVLVPALSCDRRGFRLGYGGGFYDRFLGAISGLPKVGIIFYDFIIDTLPSETWDIPMNFLGTESGIITIT